VVREPLLNRPFLLAFAANFLQCLAYNLYLHLPGFMKLLGGTEVEIGLVFGVGAAVAVVARPTMGRIIDRRGISRMIVAGGVVHTLACALYLSVGTLGPWLYVVRIIHGVGGAALFVSLFAYAADIVPASRRIEGIALFGISGMLPMSLGGLLGDLILAHAGYREVFAAAVVLAGSALVLSLPLRDQRPRAAPEPRRPGLLRAAHRDGLLPIWFVAMVFGAAVSAPFTFLKTFVMATGIGSVGLFFTVYSLAAVVLRLAFGTLPDRLGPRRVLLPALFLGAAGLVLLARAQGSSGIGVAALLLGLSHGYVFPILVGVLVTRAQPSERGASYAVFTALWDAGSMVASPAFGLLIQATGYRPMFVAAGALVLGGTLVFALWDRHDMPGAG